MNIVFYGGRQAGLVVLLTLLTTKHKISYIIPEDDLIKDIAKTLKIPTVNKSKINNPETLKLFKNKNINLLICCHGRSILKKGILNIKCINVHPCLYKYKGSKPVFRLIADNNTKASVGVHWMTEKIDNGLLIVELYKQVYPTTEAEVYNQLYPIYAKAILRALEEIKISA